MKKKTLVIIIVLIVLAVLIYYQNSLAKSKITSSTVKATGAVIQEETEKQEEEISVEEEIEVSEMQSISDDDQKFSKKISDKTEEDTIEEPIETFPETLLTDVKCINGKEITFTLNNILNKEIKTSKLTFYAAGHVIRNPICGKEIINPKESVDCKLALRLKLNKEIKFTIAYIAKRESVNIDCGI